MFSFCFLSCLYKYPSFLENERKQPVMTSSHHHLPHSLMFSGPLLSFAYHASFSVFLSWSSPSSASDVSRSVTSLSPFRCLCLDVSDVFLHISFTVRRGERNRTVISSPHLFVPFSLSFSHTSKEGRERLTGHGQRILFFSSLLPSSFHAQVLLLFILCVSSILIFFFIFES